MNISVNRCPIEAGILHTNNVHFAIVFFRSHVDQRHGSYGTALWLPGAPSWFNGRYDMMTFNEALADALILSGRAASMGMAANKNLVAAAPALLDACTVATRALSGDEISDNTGRISAVVQMLENATNKAAGKGFSVIHKVVATGSDFDIPRREQKHTKEQ